MDITVAIYSGSNSVNRATIRPYATLSRTEPFPHTFTSAIFVSGINAMLKNSDQFCNPIFVVEDFSRQDPSSFSFYYSTLNKNYTVIRYISNDFHRAKIENP